MGETTYNAIPETRGTCRNKGTYNGATARDDEDAKKLAAFLAGEGAEHDLIEWCDEIRKEAA